MEYKTTSGTMYYDDYGYNIDALTDPITPEGEGWQLVSSCCGPMRDSRIEVFWFWSRQVVRN